MSLPLTANQQQIFDLCESTKDNVLITGPPGCGKSVLNNALLERGKKRYVMSAPTGLAAINVNGSTLHRLFRIPVSEGVIVPEFNRFTDSMFTRVQLQMLKVLIIDEISMVRVDNFEFMDRMLREVRGIDRPFGGVQIIAVGDFCLKKGTKIIMADGSIRAVDDVAIGDFVMGPDGKGRQVTKLFGGTSELFKITQTNGIEYTVTGNHQLALKRRGTDRYPQYREFELVKAKDFINSSQKFRQIFGGYKVGCIEMDEKPVSIDPYFLGVWLGDGESSSTRISSPDPEILEYCKWYSGQIGLDCKTRPERSDTPCLRISLTHGNKGGTDNYLRSQLRHYNLLDNKHIPFDFLVNSSKNRLELLAGLLDTDGSWSGNRFIFCSARLRLAEETKYLADLLGFRTRINKVKNAWIVSIGGDTWRIPTKIERKKSVHRNLGRSRMTSTLDIKAVGIGDFAGFEVEGDHLFLLQDGTVMHNCQLPPVMKGQDEQVIGALWGSPYIFSSRLFSTFRTARLTEVLRQKGDNEFIDILHSARAGSLTDQQIERLNEQVGPVQGMRIQLVAVNKQAEEINNARLAALPGEETVYEASVFGEWPADPVDRIIRLKKGAQVMVKLNGADQEPGRSSVSRVVNGTLGEVVALDAKKISLLLPDGETATIWRKQFQRKIKEVVAGEWTERMVASFDQMPVCLAWSISLHKSQGQSFAEAHIDASRVFSSGQTYVGVSRVRSLAGLSLASPLTREHFKVDSKVLNWDKQIV